MRQKQRKRVGFLFTKNQTRPYYNNNAQKLFRSIFPIGCFGE